MQLLEHWNPLNLPRGSVRALITLTLAAVLWTLMLLEREPPLPLCYLVLMALGSYFGARAVPTDAKQHPLFLPRGSVRVLVILGFVVVTYFLWEQGRLTLNLRESMQDRSAAMVVLVAALLVGFLVRGLGHLVWRGEATTSRRTFENFKSLFVLVLTAFLAFVWIAASDVGNFELLAAPLLVFYFGSRT